MVEITLYYQNMAVTLSTLRTLSYNILREQENSSAYPYTLMDQMLNSAQLRICSGNVTDARTKETIRKWVLPFLVNRQFYENVLSTSVTTATSPSEPTLEVSTTDNFGDPWYLWVSGNIINFQSITATTFDWIDPNVFAIQFPFPSWTRVYKAFEMPSDFMSAVEVSYNNSMPIPYKAQKQVYRDLVPAMKGFSPIDLVQSNTSTPIQYTRVAPFYTLWAEGGSQFFLPFFIDNQGGMFTMEYEKKPTEMTTWTDESTITDDTWAKNTIPYLAVGEMLFNRWEEDRALNLLAFAYAQLREFYSFYNNQASEDMDGQAVTYSNRYFNI